MSRRRSGNGRGTEDHVEGHAFRAGKATADDTVDTRGHVMRPGRETEDDSEDTDGRAKATRF